MLPPSSVVWTGVAVCFEVFAAEDADAFDADATEDDDAAGSSALAILDLIPDGQNE